MHRLFAEERQFRVERDQYGENRYRLGKRVELLQSQVQETSDENKRKELLEEILITEAKKELANSRYEKADKLWRQRYFEQREVWGAAAAEQYVEQWKKEAEEWERKIKMNEEHLKKLESTKEPYIDEAESKHLLNEALKDGYVEVVIIVCIVLGLPGVGKTHLKFLLLDQRPPHLRTSTICAETPVRIEIRTITGTRMQTIEGKWSEIDNEDMFDVVAEMILLAEPESSNESQPQTYYDDDDDAAPQKRSKKSNVFARLINRLRKRSKSVEHLDATDSPQACASAQALDSSAYQNAMNAIMNNLIQHITKMRGKIYDSKMSELSSRKGLKTKWVYFTDSGGQPQYHELLPLFMRRISSALCVIRLPDKLNETQSVEYFKDGEQIGAAQCSQFTALDTVKCLVNTIQSYATQDNPPKIILVGTHLDKLEEQSKHDTLTELAGDSHDSHETLEEKDKQLIEILEHDYSDQLVYYSESSNEKRLLFPLNTLNPGEHEKTVAQSIRQSVETSGAKEVKIPIWWYILELLLQELAKELGRGVLSRTECLEMAHLLGIKEDSFNAALVYFDELNVIKYSPGILPDVVFVDSQIPLDKVSKFIYHSYLLRQPTSSLNIEWRHFRDQGVVSRECLKKFDHNYVPGIFSENHFIQYLKQLLVLAPIPRPPWAPSSKQLPCISRVEETHFVMPTLLPTLSEGELENWRLLSPVAATLLIKFPKGSRRAGVFCCFIVHLIQHCKWKFFLGKDEQLYRNCVRMHQVTESPPTSVVLIDSNSYIEVHVNATTGIPITEYAGLLPIIKQTILSGIYSACKTLKYDLTKPEFAFYCPHTLPSEKRKKATVASAVTTPLSSQLSKSKHTASLSSDRMYWKCDLDGDTYFGLLEDQKHTIWFGISKDLSVARSKTLAKSGKLSSPTPRNLELIEWKNKQGEKERFYLKKSICHKWKHLGTLLEISPSILSSWEQQYRGNPRDSITAVLNQWMENPPDYYPITWEGLNRLLNDAELGQVAEELKQALNNPV